MLTRVHVAPFIRVERGVIRVSYLADSDGRVVPFLDRLCRLVRRLEGRPRATVVEALRRQERRVRDATRLSGLAKTLLDLCEFRAPEHSADAPVVRDAVFRARGQLWPPVPGDRRTPYETAARQLGLSVDDVEQLLYADAPDARILRRAPQVSGRALLARYNLELARAVLLDAERITISTRGSWRAVFRAVKAARLMYVVRRAGRGYEVEVTGPAAAFVVRTTRYGARLARVVPALVRVPGWRLAADIRLADRLVHFRVRGTPRARATRSPIGTSARRARYDSTWERSLADDFRKRFRKEARAGWQLSRETSPVALGDELFLPDFTLRHADGREALIELVGFWTPEYLEAKARKVAAAGLGQLVLVVFRGLAVGATQSATEALASAVGSDRIVWFTERPRAVEVVQAAERCAVQPR